MGRERRRDRRVDKDEGKIVGASTPGVEEQLIERYDQIKRDPDQDELWKDERKRRKTLTFPYRNFSEYV